VRFLKNFSRIYTARCSVDDELEFREDHHPNLAIIDKHEKERAEDIVAIAIFVKTVLFCSSCHSGVILDRRSAGCEERRVDTCREDVRSHGSE